MKSKKNRIAIPREIASEVLYDADRTCCVCNERGKSVQIHHIDEDPSHNERQNLAVLCFECHEETQINGGFGRKLDAQQVMKFKNEWNDRIKERRKKADEIVSLRTVSESPIAEEGVNMDDYQKYLDQYWENFSYSSEQEKLLLSNYLLKIAEVKRTIYKYANQKWNTGITIVMNGASSEVISFYEEILSELAQFYPQGHFEHDPKKFFNELISSKYKWHRHIKDTFGLGRNGTLMSTLVGWIVKSETDELVKQMAAELCEKYGIDYEKWQLKWNKTKAV
jgi:hypothetical protein